jgi:hypothetical protein
MIVKSLATDFVTKSTHSLFGHLSTVAQNSVHLNAHLIPPGKNNSQSPTFSLTDLHEACQVVRQESCQKVC